MSVILKVTLKSFQSCWSNHFLDTKCLVRNQNGSSIDSDKGLRLIIIPYFDLPTENCLKIFDENREILCTVICK